MKQVSLTLAILCAACAATFAGPEAIQSSSKDMKEVVQQPVLEMSCFAGWYIGVHGGGLISNFDLNVTADQDSIGGSGNGPTPAFDHTDGGEQGSGAVGAHIGFTWIRPSGWGFGFEADGSWSGLDKSHDADAVFANLDGAGDGSDPDIFVSTRVKSNIDVDWYSTARLRFGHTIGQRLFAYATGGFAFGGTDLNQKTEFFSWREGEGVLDTADFHESNDDVKIGWTAGAGLDFCLTHHIILNFTYLYVDLENSSVREDQDFFGDSSVGGAREFHVIGRSHSDNNFHVLQGGLSFKF